MEERGGKARQEEGREFCAKQIVNAKAPFPERPGL
jgi:hypothetical protein